MKETVVGGVASGTWNLHPLARTHSLFDSVGVFASIANFLE